MGKTQFLLVVEGKLIEYLVVKGKLIEFFFKGVQPFQKSGSML